MAAFKKERPAAFIRGFCLLAISSMLMLTGCANQGGAAVNQGASKGYGKISLGYTGDITEVPLFAALERGFFKEEGLDVKLVKVDFGNIGKEFSSGRISGVSADYRYLNALEKGLNVKLTAGLHSGCTQILTAPDSDIDKIRKLKGRTIGVEAFGNGPMTVAAKLLRNNGVDPAKDVKWKEFKGPELYRAIITYEVDAVSVWETAGGYKACSVLFSTSAGSGGTAESGSTTGTGGLAKSGGSSGSHTHSGYQHFYSSFIALDSNLVKKQQDKAAAVSRAWMRGVKWVSENRKEAAELAVQNKYVDMDEEAALKAVDDFMWIPGVRYARLHLKDYIREQKAQRLLRADMDENRFLKDIFRQIVPDFNGL